ncbi:MAG: asparagine synthase-related protein [Rhizobiaceae bacterium]
MGVICGVYAPKKSISFRDKTLISMGGNLSRTTLQSHRTDFEGVLGIEYYEHPNFSKNLKTSDYANQHSDGDWLIGDLSFYNRESFPLPKSGGDLARLHNHLSENGNGGIVDICGDFCLIRFDATNGIQTFFRDTIGQKSIFFTKTDFGYVFSSIVQPVHTVTKHSQTLSPQALASFMYLQHPGRGKTYHEKIFEIPTATISEIEEGDVQSSKIYWVPSKQSVISNLSLDAQVKALRNELDRSVRQRLSHRVNKSALQLSGGLDSSSIAGLMSHYRPDETIQAISNVLPPNYSGNASDERFYIESVLSRWTNILPNYVSDCDNELLSSDGFWRDWFCAPNPDFFHNVNTAIETKMEEIDCEVLLSGLGGDEGVSARGIPALTEFFYSGKIGAAKNEYLRLRNTYENSKFLKIIVAKLLIPIAPNALRRFAKKLKNTDWRKNAPITDQFVLSKSFQKHLETNGFEKVPSAHRSMYQYEISNLTVFDHYNLPVYDFAANLRGHKVRYPFLDHKLIDCLVSIATDLKVSTQLDRMLLRTACKELLPETVRMRKDKKLFCPGFIEQFSAAETRINETILKAAENPVWKTIVNLEKLAETNKNHKHSQLEAAFEKLKLYSLGYFLLNEAEPEKVND